MDTALAVVGTVLTFVAAVATIVAVVFARKTVILTQQSQNDANLARQDAQASRKHAELARKDADAQRREARRDRERDRIEYVGELIETIFWAAKPDERYNPPTPPDDAAWKPLRNRIRRALIGLGDQLPKCANVLQAYGPEQTVKFASEARDEIAQALQHVDEQSALDRRD